MLYVQNKGGARRCLKLLERALKVKKRKKKKDLLRLSRKLC